MIEEETDGNIRCSCGYIGNGEIQEIDFDIHKALILCPSCGQIHIKNLGDGI